MVDLFSIQTSTGTFAAGCPESSTDGTGQSRRSPDFQGDPIAAGTMGSGRVCGTIPGAVTRTVSGSTVAGR